MDLPGRETDVLVADDVLVARLRAGDENTFRRLIEEWNAPLVRVALMFLPTRALAEEVVQETWVRVLGAIDRFEGRSSLKTWVFRILVNTAKTRAQRERRTVPFSALEQDGPTVEPERFVGGHWSAPPAELPEERLLASETREVIAAAIEALPPSQRAVISLRDVEGWSSEEVRNALDISEVNQRVLLHRARARVRQALEDYFS